MSTLGPKTESNAGDDPTWTNETLPLDVRRALLNQELERFTARRRPASGVGTDAGGASPRHHPASGGNHPSAAGGDTDHD